MTKVYIVKEDSHDGERYSSYIIKAFFDKYKADELVKYLNLKLKADRGYTEHLWDTHVRECEEDSECPLCDKYFKLQNKNVYVCVYSVETVEVE